MPYNKVTLGLSEDLQGFLCLLVLILGRHAGVRLLCGLCLEPVCALSQVGQVLLAQLVAPGRDGLQGLEGIQALLNVLQLLLQAGAPRWKIPLLLCLRVICFISPSTSLDLFGLVRCSLLQVRPQARQVLLVARSAEADKPCWKLPSPVGQHVT